MPEEHACQESEKRIQLCHVARKHMGHMRCQKRIVSWHIYNERSDVETEMLERKSLLKV